MKKYVEDQWNRLKAKSSPSDELAKTRYALHQLRLKRWVHGNLIEGRNRWAALENNLPSREDLRALDLFEKDGHTVDPRKVEREIEWMQRVESHVDWVMSKKELTLPIGLYGDDGTLVYYVMCAECGTIVMEHLDCDDCLTAFVCPTCLEKEIKAPGYWWKYFAAESEDWLELVKMLNHLIDFDKKYHFGFESRNGRFKFYPFRIKFWVRNKVFKIKKFIGGRDDSSRDKM